MARAGSYWSRWRPAALVWVSSAVLIYLGLRAAMKNSRSSVTMPESSVSITDRRARLYDKLARDLEEHGAAFLRGGETSQALSLSDIFSLKDGKVVPVLKAANPPVRANVLYLSPEFSVPMSQALRDAFLPYFDNVIWFQNTSLYHFSMFHASHHLTPVSASETEVEAEANAVKAVAAVLCPLTIVLDRVVLTSTGVLLGCWQVISGTDPLIIRTKLRNALPRAPDRQLYDLVMLHTSFARILGHPNISLEEIKRPFDVLQFFHELVLHVNERIHGFKSILKNGKRVPTSLRRKRYLQATVSELWFVEEFDVLALALNGKMKMRRFKMGCKGV